MRERLYSHGRIPYPSFFAHTSPIIIAMILTIGGCNEAAGLHDHQPYQGFPDSVDVPCSDGSMLVNCASVRNSVPQDGHVLTAKPAYEISGAEVHDPLPGLAWYRTPGDADAHDKAIEYCNVLPGDYRLPTRIELASLLDFRADSPVRIDTTTFPDVKPTAYWTASRYGSDVNQYWTVDFCSNCTTEYPIISAYVGNNAGILCVKSAGEPFETGPFEVAGVEERFLRDMRTGLMWMKKPIATNKNWADSMQTCQKAPDGAYGDFRVPNAKELATIVDNDKVGSPKPSIQNPFELEYNQQIWSSTPSSKPGKFFILNATGGSLHEEDGVLTYFQVLCVRGPD